MKPKRKSQTLAWLKAEFRSEALKLPEGEERDRLWRWYYRVQTAEFEVNALCWKQKSARCCNMQWSMV